MKKVLLSILAISTVFNSYSTEPSMYRDLFQSVEQFSPTDFCAQNCDQLINFGMAGFAAWATLPYIGFFTGLMFDTVHGTYPYGVLSSIKSGRNMRRDTEYIVPPVMLALIGAGVYGALQR